MITVYAKLFATLRAYRPGLGIGEALAVQVPAGATVGDLIAQLQLPEDEVKIVFVNALNRGPAHVLADGDELGLFPPIGGG